MTRISKDPVERKNEIREVAEELFVTQGFEQTSINDIVERIGVAKGLFYYYFKSKEDVLNAIAERYNALLIEKVKAMAKDDSICPITKLRQLFAYVFDLAKNKDELIIRIHQKQFAEIHQKLTLQATEQLIPIFIRFLREGMAKGEFTVKEPEVAMEILLPGLGAYLHKLIPECWGKPEYKQKFNSAMLVVEQILGVPAGSLRI